jgi:release factor glutamine methyltransferase
VHRLAQVGELAGRLDLVVSNPPYVAAGEIPGLEPEVALHEPRLATTPGDDGLALYRRLLPEAVPDPKASATAGTSAA